MLIKREKYCQFFFLENPDFVVGKLTISLQAFAILVLQIGL
jgi:hypothetical protein